MKPFDVFPLFLRYIDDILMLLNEYETSQNNCLNPLRKGPTPIIFSWNNSRLHISFVNVNIIKHYAKLLTDL